MISERLAACVQGSEPVTSHYRWQGKVEQAREWVLTCKTASEQVEALIARRTTLHPYDLPEVVVLDADASSAYAVWARAATTDEPNEGMHPPYASRSGAAQGEQS